MKIEGRRKDEKEIIRPDSGCIDDVSICDKGKRRGGIPIDFRQRNGRGKTVRGPGTDTRAVDEPFGQGGTG